MHEAVIDSDSYFLLRNIHSSFVSSALYMATRETEKPLLFSAMLGSTDELAMMRLFFSD